jgi:hypothetical protein
VKLDPEPFRALLALLRSRRGALPSQDSTQAQLERVRALLQEYGVTDQRQAVMVANACGEYDAADVLAAQPPTEDA